MQALWGKVRASVTCVLCLLCLLLACLVSLSALSAVSSACLSLRFVSLTLFCSAVSSACLSLCPISLSALLFFCLFFSSPRQLLDSFLCSAVPSACLSFCLISLSALLFLLLAFLFASSVSLFCCFFHLPFFSPRQSLVSLFFACLFPHLPSRHSQSNCCWVTSIHALHTTWGLSGSDVVHP